MIKIEKMKAELPYGKYVCLDGTEILFNRRYEPIISSLNDNLDEAQFKEKVLNAKKIYFYNDSNPPWKDKNISRKCTAILKLYI